MRKLISLILAVLMVSMMIPAMVLAEDSATPVDYEGLVAGETFTVEVTGLTSATATISVNTQLFSIDGATVEGSIASKTVDVVGDKATLDVKVNALVPAVATSRIKIVAGETTNYQVAAIADVKLGDVNKDGAVDIIDANILARYDAGLAEICSIVVGDVTLDENTTADIIDANVVARYDAGIPTNEYVGEAYAGGNETPEGGIKDPFVKKLAKPANGYAYAQNGKIYYTFDAVEGATDYVIKSGETEIATVQTATGSFEYENFVEGMKITITATADEIENSDPSDEIEVIKADASGALAEWLEENGLENVAITVHEIK